MQQSACPHTAPTICPSTSVFWCRPPARFLPQALQRVPLFAGLDSKTKGAIASALGQVSMPKGTAVVTQGERGHAFYIVESGQLSAFKDNSPLPVLSYGPGADHLPMTVLDFQV
jgi:hypothetical protein